MFTFATYNTKDYLRNPDELARARLVEQVVAGLGADAIALQELPGHSPRRAAEGLKQLAQATGMACLLPGVRGAEPAPAIAIGHDQLSVGLLWRPGTVEPIPGTSQAYEGEQAGFWHALLAGEFEVQGQRVALASSHAPPRAGRERRVPEAHRLAELLGDYAFVVLGQDRNSVGADLTSEGNFYDPDPHQPDAHSKWGDPLPETGYPTDRTPSAILTAAGLVDMQPYLRLPWEATTGRHWPDERNGPRRLDEIRASEAMARCAVSLEVVDSRDAFVASDHLPVVATFNLAG